MVLTAAVLGCGDRGSIYADYSIDNPKRLEIVAAVDINHERLKNFAEKHNISEGSCFSSWEDFLDLPKQADMVFVTLPDSYHFLVAKKALTKNYHVLLEKPMATSPHEIKSLVEFSQKQSLIFQICHVLRYTHFYQTVKELIDRGEIGQVVNIQMSENVAYYHYAHSYIRGNWNNRENSAPMILTKSSHDLDLMYWFADALPRVISSFGSQQFFGEDNRPPGAPDRCTDGCPVADSCLYYAPRIYLDLIPLLHGTSQQDPLPTKLVKQLAIKYPALKKYPPFSAINAYRGWPVNVITEDPTFENKLRALEEGPYGRCVYSISDHSVIDHQVVNVEFANGVTGNFVLHGHSSEERRILRIDGTEGTIEGKFSFVNSYLEVTDSLTHNREIIINGRDTGRHGGGDLNLLEEFLSNVENNTLPMTNAETSSVSHFMAYVADKSRLEEDVMDYQDFIRSI